MNLNRALARSDDINLNLQGISTVLQKFSDEHDEKFPDAKSRISEHLVSMEGGLVKAQSQLKTAMEAMKADLLGHTGSMNVDFEKDHADLSKEIGDALSQVVQRVNTALVEGGSDLSDVETKYAEGRAGTIGKLEEMLRKVATYSMMLDKTRRKIKGEEGESEQEATRAEKDSMNAIGAELKTSQSFLNGDMSKYKAGTASAESDADEKLRGEQNQGKKSVRNKAEIEEVQDAQEFNSATEQAGQDREKADELSAEEDRLGAMEGHYVQAAQEQEQGAEGRMGRFRGDFDEYRKEFEEASERANKKLAKANEEVERRLRRVPEGVRGGERARQQEARQGQRGGGAVHGDAVRRHPAEGPRRHR